MKPFKGEIHNWKKIDLSSLTDEGLAYKIFGRPVGHPTIINWILTSLIIKELPDGRVETLNSVYKLVGEEVSGPCTVLE